MRLPSFATPLMAAAILLSLSTASAARNADREGAAAVLASYKLALERRDLSGVDALFARDAVVIESGKVEGTYEAYRDHHLGPELAEFKSFTFENYQAQIRLEGPIAVATETYSYRIVTKSDEVVDRLGVASSVLKWNGQAWQIVSMHSSSRKPKAPPSDRGGRAFRTSPQADRNLA